MKEYLFIDNNKRNAKQQQQQKNVMQKILIFFYVILFTILQLSYFIIRLQMIKINNCKLINNNHKDKRTTGFYLLDT